MFTQIISIVIVTFIIVSLICLICKYKPEITVSSWRMVIKYNKIPWLTNTNPDQERIIKCIYWRKPSNKQKSHL
jgi:hypothetical protein